MTETPYDVIIIGGGPGGSAAGTFLAQAGKKVLILEKEIFPRFHIGESLLPYNTALFEEMGVLETLKQSGFPRKFGAQFHIGNGSRSTYFVFRNGQFTRQHEAFQVERAKFDHILLRHTAQCGAEVREGWLVNRFSCERDQLNVQAKSVQGENVVFRAKYLIDASGRGNLTGNQEGIRVVHPRLKKVAVFGHFEGVKVDPGEKGGDTVIVRLENKWFWLIPLSQSKVSVGCVMDQEELRRSGKQPSALFHEICTGSPPMQERMREAKLIGEIQTTSDFSYHNKTLAGPRLLRVGDAAGFMDPIFSAGVYLAMMSGKLAAKTLIDALGSSKEYPDSFRRYERRIHSAMETYWEMVENFYTTPFMELFMSPREKFQLASAVNAILAGELDGGWQLRWRMRLFFFLVRIQTRWPFLPRISFDTPDASTPELPNKSSA